MSRTFYSLTFFCSFKLNFLSQFPSWNITSSVPTCTAVPHGKIYYLILVWYSRQMSIVLKHVQSDHGAVEMPSSSDHPLEQDQSTLVRRSNILSLLLIIISYIGWLVGVVKYYCVLVSALIGRSQPQVIVSRLRHCDNFQNFVI